MADDKFEFPEPQEVNTADADDSVEFEIEVVDDTPPEDRNRKPLESAPSEVTEDELAGYSEKVRKRIQTISRGYHDERRAKEAAVREAEEARKLAQSIIDENNKLKGTVNQNQQTLLEQAKKVTGQELEDARRKFKVAYEAGDADALTDAQEALAAAKFKVERVNTFRPTPLQPTNNQVLMPVAQQIDPAVADWSQRNQWFGSDEGMTKVALDYHNRLVNSGVDPKSEEYYDKIDSRMRQVFPESFADSDQVTEEKPRRKASVVAPATRSTAPKKIVLSATAVALAKKLGVPLDVYARSVAEQTRKQNG